MLVPTLLLLWLKKKKFLAAPCSMLGISASQPVTEPMPPAAGAQSPSHWISRAVATVTFLKTFLPKWRPWSSPPKSAWCTALKSTEKAESKPLAPMHRVSTKSPFTAVSTSQVFSFLHVSSLRQTGWPKVPLLLLDSVLFYFTKAKPKVTHRSIWTWSA